MQSTTRSKMFDNLMKLASEVTAQSQKTAIAPAATSSSSHPTEKAPDKTRPAPHGEQAAKLEKDQKAIPNSVDNAKANTPEQDSCQTAIGMNPSSTGNDPSVERDFKGTLHDPGTTHPARFDDGKKYGGATLKELNTLSGDMANAIMADIARNGAVNTTQKQSSAQPAAQPAATPAADSIENHPAFAAGYKLAAALGVTKEAAFQHVTQQVQRIHADANFDADLFGPFYTNTLKKLAEAMPAESPTETPAEVPPEAAAAAATPPAGEPAAGPGGAGMDDEAAIIQLIAALEELGIPLEELLQRGAPAGGAMPSPAMPPGDAAPMPLKVAHTVYKFRRSGKYRFKEANDGTPERDLREAFKVQLLEMLK
jgi:hypothetical protein